MIEEDLVDRDFVCRYVNWRDFLAARHPGRERSFEQTFRRLAPAEDTPGR